MNESSPHLDEFVSIVGDENLFVNLSDIQKSIRDNSWFSPLLTKYIDELKTDRGKTLQVDAVVSPKDVRQLRAVIALAVRHNIPMTVRGAATGNFGQMIPLKGGILIDIRRLAGILEVTEDSITVAAGTVVADVYRAARAHGKDLTLYTTTHAVATAAGWIAGGHVGLGSMSYGTIWDGNVLMVKMLTAEDPPRELTLTGEDLVSVLHTYGTTGIMTEVTFPLVEALEWLEAVAVFDSFEEAIPFTAAMAGEVSIMQRACIAQEPSISIGFIALQSLFEPGQSIVELIIDASKEARCRELCESSGGVLHIWKKPDDALKTSSGLLGHAAGRRGLLPGSTEDKPKISLDMMVFGHRMLWIKKLAPDAGFLHLYFSPERYLEQLQALKKEFGSEVWLELKFMRSSWLRALLGLSGEEPVPIALLTLVSGSEDFLKTVMRFCDSIKVNYRNPHTFLLDECGLFPDFQPIADFKHQTDPKGLLNPGKIGAKFMTQQEVL